MIKYSIIIPHYNAPELLMRCLKSIPISEEIQVIVVDDCSPQADKYISMYPELSRPYLEFYSTGTNGGGGKARNVGLTHAKGEWVLFADSDDFFVDGIYDILNKYCKEKVDIIFFKARTCKANNLQHEVRGFKQDLYDIYSSRGDERIFRYCYTEPWGKMIRLNLIRFHKIYFEEVCIANDFLFSVKSGYYAKKIRVSYESIYTYVLTESSTSRGKRTKEKMEARIMEKVKVQKFLESKNIRSCYNLLTYVPRMRSFFPIISRTEIDVFKKMNYPVFPVIFERIQLLLHKLVNNKLSLNSNTRKFY